MLLEALRALPNNANATCNTAKCPDFPHATSRLPMVPTVNNAKAWKPSGTKASQSKSSSAKHVMRAYFIWMMPADTSLLILRMISGLRKCC